MDPMRSVQDHELTGRHSNGIVREGMSAPDFELSATPDQEFPVMSDGALPLAKSQVDGADNQA
jgi:hypothetical protein